MASCTQGAGDARLSWWKERFLTALFRFSWAGDDTVAQKVGVVPFSTLTLPLPKILRGLTKSHDKPSACGLVGKRFGEMGADKPQPPVHSHCGQHQRHLRFLLLRVGFVPLLDDGSKRTQIVSDRKGSVAFKREILVSEGLLPNAPPSLRRLAVWRLMQSRLACLLQGSNPIGRTMRNDTQANCPRCGVGRERRLTMATWTRKLGRRACPGWALGHCPEDFWWASGHRHPVLDLCCNMCIIRDARTTQ